ncbi:hypothetical protein C8R43DRAFT_346705 [Mycena crocata]|nr:hypothetical protein C8R43DRAFT_346705 [Mycena crocata]
MPAQKIMKPDSVPPLLNISSLVDIQPPFQILSDGRKRKRASAFRVDVRSEAFESGQEQCFLKIFPADEANTVCFRTECEANFTLNLHVSKNLAGIHKDAQIRTPSLEAFKVHLQLASKHPWPLCYGYTTVADPFFEAPLQSAQQRRKNTPQPTASKLYALLFQFFDDLTLCSPNHIDEAGVMRTKILHALMLIHAANIVHWDLEERTVWPEVGFRNIYIRNGEPVILDFDHSKIIHGEDRKRFEEEETQIKELITKAVESQGRERGWGLSKEARRLL